MLRVGQPEKDDADGQLSWDQGSQDQDSQDQGSHEQDSQGQVSDGVSDTSSIGSSEENEQQKQDLLIRSLDDDIDLLMELLPTLEHQYRCAGLIPQISTKAPEVAFQVTPNAHSKALHLQNFSLFHYPCNIADPKILGRS
jgi:hypothetical protein